MISEDSVMISEDSVMISEDSMMISEDSMMISEDSMMISEDSMKLWTLWTLFKKNILFIMASFFMASMMIDIQAFYLLDGFIDPNKIILLYIRYNLFIYLV